MFSMKTDAAQTHVIKSFFNTLNQPYAANYSTQKTVAPVYGQGNHYIEEEKKRLNALQNEAINWLFDNIRIERQTAYGVTAPKCSAVENKDDLFSTDYETIKQAGSLSQSPTDARMFDENGSLEAVVTSSQLPINNELTNTPFKECNTDVARRLPCTYCNQLFKSNFGLTQHIKARHTGNKQFICPCGKRFISENSLSTHKLTHAKENQRHACTQCTKSFFYKQDLKRHARLHHGENPYKCKFCQKGFDRSCHLAVHENTHIKRMYKKQNK